jgi:hypothetical protein
MITLQGSEKIQIKKKNIFYYRNKQKIDCINKFLTKNIMKINKLPGKNQKSIVIEISRHSYALSV